MDAKERYKAAMSHLDSLLAEYTPTNGQPDSKQLLDDVRRYSGELRRRMSFLEGQADQDRREISSSKQELARLQALASKLEQIERAKVEMENANAKLNARNIALQDQLQSIADVGGKYSSVDDHTQVKVKCLECGLHYALYSWSPDAHKSETLYCPECGQHHGNFMVWHEPGKGFIFQNVPGEAELSEIGKSQPSRLDRILDERFRASEN